MLGSWVFSLLSHIHWTHFMPWTEKWRQSQPLWLQGKVEQLCCGQLKMTLPRSSWGEQTESAMNISIHDCNNSKWITWDHQPSLVPSFTTPLTVSMSFSHRDQLTCSTVQPDWKPPCKKWRIKESGFFHDHSHNGLAHPKLVNHCWRRIWSSLLLLRLEGEPGCTLACFSRNINFSDIRNHLFLLFSWRTSIG